MKENTRIKWSYDHHLNSNSISRKTKYGYFIAYPVMRRGEKLAAVQFDGNKNPSYIPIIEMRVVKCRVCGCTDENACPGGCSWANRDICTSCVDKQKK